ncbi:hypothetical protein [Streptomyces sp. NPDC051132]|uniref:GP88 family protein n=1 Tax=unclassified Streptomyces TaxID=2593676 RepID=UPI0034491654
MNTSSTTDTPRTKLKARRWLLTQNRQLRAEGIFNWPLPAWAGRFSDGSTYNACPEAGACAKRVVALAVSPTVAVALGGGCVSCVRSGVRVHRVSFRPG